MFTKLKYHVHFAKVAVKRKYPEVFPVKMVKTFDVIYETNNGRVHLRYDPLDWLDKSLGDLMDWLSGSPAYWPKDRIRYGTKGEILHTYGAVIFLDHNNDTSKGGGQIVNRLWARREIIMGKKFFTHDSVGVYFNTTK